MRRAAPLALMLLVACSRTPSGEAAPAPPASTAPAPSAAPSAPARPVAETWTGTYTSARGAYFIPRENDVPNAKDWESVRQRPEDAGLGLGTGPLTLVVDRVAGRVTGTLDGPLGPAVVAGTFADAGVITATVARRSATDQGLTGTLVAKPAADKLEGTMKLSEWNAVVLRDVAFTLHRAP